MAPDNSSSNDNGGAAGTALLDRDAVQRVKEEAQRLAQMKGRDLARSLGDRVTELTGHLDEVSENGGSALPQALSGLLQGKSPVKAAVSAGAGKLRDRFGGSGGGSKQHGKTVSIVEHVDIGLPRATVYNQWTQFTEFSRFTKGVQQVEQDDDEHLTWRAKIAFSTRTWRSTITQQVPDQRIAWTSEGDKGSVDGVVTFHELAPDLTRVILDLRYHPVGLFERTGNLWRAQGRRARLDLKKFREFVNEQGEETGSWRGEIGEQADGAEGSENEPQGAEGQERKKPAARKPRSSQSRRSPRRSGDEKSTASADDEKEAS